MFAGTSFLLFTGFGLFYRNHSKERFLDAFRRRSLVLVPGTWLFADADWAGDPSIHRIRSVIFFEFAVSMDPRFHGSSCEGSPEKLRILLSFISFDA